MIIIKRLFTNQKLLQQCVHSFFNLTSDGIVIVDLKGKVLEVNKTFERMHGWSYLEVIGKVLPMTPEEEKEGVFQLYQRITEGEEIASFEAQKLRKDGSVFYADVTVSPLKDEHGQVIAFVGIERDITEKKKAQEALKESEERYRVLVENSPEPIVVYRDYVISFVNPAAMELMGAQRAEELQGQLVSRYLHPEDLALLPEQLRQLFAAGRASDVLEKRLIRVDGTIVNVEVKAVPVHLHGQLSVQLLFRDVTDRKRAEFELAKREEEYRRVLKLSPEPIVLHQKAIITFVNDSAIKLLDGKGLKEFIGRSIFDFFCPSHHSIVADRLNRVLQSDEVMEFTELNMRRLDGTILEVEASSIYIHKEIGDPVIQTVLRDMTERRKTEEMVRRSEKLSIVGELAAGVAHEIRNPLTALKGFLQLLMQKQTAYTDIMLVEIERINTIVNEFMSMAKPHSVTYIPVDLQGLFENVVFIMQPQAHLFNVQMSLDMQSALPPVHCDPNQIKQVLMNLLKNAIESMSHGGEIKITVHAAKDQRVIIRIIDQGSGIPEHQLAKIGIPFFSTKDSGTGLGLAVCYRIIAAHKGSMSFQSKINEGTVVEIDLPLHVVDREQTSPFE